MTRTVELVALRRIPGYRRGDIIVASLDDDTWSNHVVAGNVKLLDEGALDEAEPVAQVEVHEEPQPEQAAEQDDDEESSEEQLDWWTETNTADDYADDEALD